MFCWKTWYILKHYILNLVVILLYFHGFFPYSAINSTQQANKDLIRTQCTHFYPSIDRLVLIVIDALRLDFVTSENMPFTSKLTHENGCFITLQVNSPTVTLPRIKSLTTGSIPQFLDLIFNLLDVENLNDSLLHQLKNSNKTIVFYGDDTWLKLYPDIFTRHEGVTSFYVNDYEQVDYNVTRNVNKELKKNDWDVMILHYLGLDHIGHLEGPFSELIPPKLRYMDEVIKRIKLELKSDDIKTLIAITGDHGMKDSGGHGGATFAETHVPLILSGISCKNETAAQIDVTPTFSALLGVEIPSTTVGSVIFNCLQTLNLDSLLHILKCNAFIIKSNSNFDIFDDYLKNASINYDKFIADRMISSGQKAIDFYEKFMILSKDKITHSFAQQNHILMIYSLIFAVFCLFLLFNSLFSDQKSNNFVLKMYDVCILSSLILFLWFGSEISLLTILLSLIIFSKNMIAFQNQIKENLDLNLLLVICFIVYHSISLLSSSFIEEEHQVWYYFWSFLMCFQLYYSLSRSFRSTAEFFVIFTAFRFIRKINQTGDKWAHIPGISQWFLASKNYFYLHIFVIVNFILIYILLRDLIFTKSTRLLFIIELLVVYITKHFFSDYHFLYNLFYIIILILIIIFVTQKQIINGIIIVWILNSVLLLRAYNVVLIVYCVYSCFVLKKRLNNKKSLVFFHYVLGNALFFCQGNSNSFSSVDIAVGYVGLNHYNQLVVTLQVLFHTYTFPILCNLICLSSLKNGLIFWSVNSVFRSLSLIFTMVSVTIHKNHLFVWTVFAPKLLIEIIHFLVLFLQFILIQLCTKM